MGRVLVRETKLQRLRLVGGLLFSFVLMFFDAKALAAQIQLTLLHCWAGDRTAWVDDKIKLFEAANPNVTVQTTVSGCGADIAGRFITSIASGAPYDVAMIAPNTLLPLAEQGAVAPLDEYIARKGLEYDMWFPSELQSGQWQGRTYGLPLTTGGDGGTMLIYNRQIFEEAGLNPDAPPTTFDELFEVSRSLTRFDGDKIVLAPFDFVDEGTAGPLSWVYAGGGSVLSPDGTTATYDGPEALETMEYIRNYIQTYLRGPQNIIGGRVEAFQVFRVAMVGRHSGRYAEVKAFDPDFPIGLGLRPRAQDSPWVGGNLGGWLYSMPATTPNPDAAWELIYWLTVPKETAGWFNLRQGRPSPIIEYNQDPTYFEVNPYFAVVAQAIALSAPVFLGRGFTEAHDEFRSTWVKLIRDHSIDARAALAESARIATAKLREAQQR